MIELESAASLGADISQFSLDGIPDPLENLSSCLQPGLTELIEAITFWFHEKYGSEEFVQALKMFQQNIGKVYYEEAFYHERMTYFLDFFLFQRPVESQDSGDSSPSLTPYLYFLQSEYCEGKILPNLVIEQLHSLQFFKHSVFEVCKIRPEKMIVKDLFDEKKIEIKPQHLSGFQGFFKGDILQGFVFPIGSLAYLSKGIIVHPKEVASPIKGNIKKLKKSGEFHDFSFLAKIAKYNASYLRHRQISPKKVYQLT